MKSYTALTTSQIAGRVKGMRGPISEKRAEQLEQLCERLSRLEWNAAARGDETLMRKAGNVYRRAADRSTIAYVSRKVALT
jgi:hypothetical protein